ncbi:uncharacterized protein F4807DRAFT_367720 [Annulohypoxylon truncatum]|uniref:uncharacterized protein n=1 Tax=Annulohypoxylon truncatum TaxID=327061 RepID=UPI0020085C19|nr:uncharacterized protein F4807DRAFT_367720 [Annulohypoxylon truncatum]KAI1212353.1 hypothetical protein F4807DRAFT_367720 [Annulohypoxylon truncatum]
MAEYTGLEPTETHADESNIFDQIDFDSNEIQAPEGFFSFFEPSEPQDSEPGPVDQGGVDEVSSQSLSQCIDPKLLDNDYDATADVVVEQQPPENHGTNYPVANPMTNFTNGNVVYNAPYPPMSNYAPAMNFPQNNFQYPYLPATNPPYLGHGAGYPVYVMQYPPPEQAYPTADATYVLPEALPPTAQPTHHIVTRNGSQPRDLPPARIAPSFNSSLVDPKIFEARRSRVPSPIIIYHKPPLKRPTKGPNGESLKNDRIPRVTRKNQPRPNPREWYGPPLSPPESWGPKDKTGRPVFKYTEYGELERGRSYSQKEMRWYLYGPKVHEDFELPKPLPNVPEVENKTRQGLTIWIGWVASQSNERYPHGSQSQRCRFADCPDPNHTIRAGFPRVIFDERTNVDADAIDPFHNAGYAHLFCFEKHFDLVQAFHHLDVRADERDFKREENLGRLSRQFPEIRNELDLWWRDQYPKFLEHGKNRDRSYEQSLSYRLICHTLEHSSEGRVKMRESRGGADMSKHKGDLVELRFLKDCMAEGLMDRNGDPRPGAREYLADLNAKGKRKKKGIVKRIGHTDSPISAGLHMDRPPQSAQSGSYIHGFTPSAEFVPMPQPSSMNFPVPRGGLSMAATNFNQTMAAALYQPGPVPADRSQQKRDRNEVLFEDQQGSYSNNQEAQEPQTKRRRLSHPGSPRPNTPTDQIPLPHDASQHLQANRDNGPSVESEEHDGLPADFPPLDLDLGHRDEVELDDSAVFNIIDEEMPSGELPTGDNVNTAAEIEVDGSHDSESEEDDDLFGDPDDADYNPEEDE